MTNEEFQGYVKAKLDLIPEILRRLDRCRENEDRRMRELETQVASLKGASGVIGFFAGLCATVIGWFVKR